MLQNTLDDNKKKRSWMTEHRLNIDEEKDF